MARFWEVKGSLCTCIGMELQNSSPRIHVSRRVLGRVGERSAVLLLCAVDGELAHVRQLITAASCLLLEQFSTIKCFNVMWYLSFIII